MAKDKYLTSPPKITSWPPGVPYIIGNEAAERFSYYGMNSVLTIFMTKYLVDKMGHLSVMPAAPRPEAWYHTFVVVLYFLAVVRRDSGRRILREIQSRSLAVDRLLPRARHARPDGLVGRARDRAALFAGALAWS